MVEQLISWWNNGADSYIEGTSREEDDYLREQPDWPALFPHGLGCAE
jgi:hypothetical protein